MLSSVAVSILASEAPLIPKKFMSWLGVVGAIAATVAGQAEVVGSTVAQGATLVAALIGSIFGNSILRGKSSRSTDVPRRL